VGQVTTTSPFGRKPEIEGYPLNMSEMLSTLKGAVFVERVSLHDIKNIKNAKKAIMKAFKVQQAGLGFSIVEVLSSCPTNWGLEPVQALKWIEDKMIPQYPLGNFKGKDLEV
jgi:2-oxoglutarate ferredoxin oxidoreductase subunit beta